MRGRPRRRDDGTSIVLFALTLSTLVVFLALVIDLGQARNRAEDNRLSADEAALAGASVIGGGGDDACAAAWEYVRVNAGFELSEVTQLPVCSSFDPVCNSLVSRNTTAVWQDTEITFTYPVKSGDPLLGTQPVNASVDLGACNRFGVTIQTTQDNQIASGSIELEVSAVAVNDLDPAVHADAAIIALAPSGCNVITVSGNANVSVDGGAPGYPQILVDSTGCPSTDGDYVLYSTADPGIVVTEDSGAAGTIGMHSLDGANSASSYDPTQVTSGNINTEPIAITAPVTRAPVDERYGDAIADLEAAYGGTGAPAGFNTWWPQPADHTKCDFTDTATLPAGNWYIPCATVKGTLVIQGGGQLVFDQMPASSGSGKFLVGCADATCSDDPLPTTMFIRGGGGNINGGALTVLHETFVYADDDVTFDINGNHLIEWTAPDEEDYAFDDLALWSENTTATKINGTADAILEGVFFVPNKTLQFTGAAGTSSPLGAQLWADKLDLGGGGTVVIKPRAERLIQVRVPGSESIVAGLIR